MFLTYFGILKNKNNIIVSRKFYRFSMFFLKKYLKNLKNIFKKQQKNSGLKGWVCLLIMWLDPHIKIC